MTHQEENDRRQRKTKMAIFRSFEDLVMSRRYDDIKVNDIVENADIGRSTFYDHFKSKDDVFLASIEPLLSMLAQGVASMGAMGQGNRAQVQFVLEHFWEKRQFARIIFASPIFNPLVAKLADMICDVQLEETRLSTSSKDHDKAEAIKVAAGLLTTIKAWVHGEFWLPANDLVAVLLGPAE